MTFTNKELTFNVDFTTQYSIMENLFIKASDKTPAIEFNVSGELRISGRSIPENSYEFYQPVISWLENFKKANVKSAVLHVNLEYFNTSSSKVLLSVFRNLEHLRELGVDTNVYWYHSEDDEDITEAGKGYQCLVKIPFRFVELA